MSIEKVLHITEDTFENEIINSNLPVLVDFWAPWCGPCRMLGPIIDSLAEEFDGRAKIAKINVDENANLARRYNVMTIPTVLIIKNGQVMETSIGAKPKEEFADMLDKVL